MIFKRLLGRRKEPTPAPPDQDDLIRVVRSDPDATVRRDAARQIQRLPELRTLTSSDADAGIRNIALARYRNLLCGQDDGGPTLQERLEEIEALQDQRILEQLAIDARQAQARHAAIVKIANPDVLASCALNDALAANRSTAVERLDDKKALDQVVKNIGKKDKKVYRAARHKLKEIAEREALPERIRTKCEELCEKAERLGRFGHWVQDRAMLDLLDRQWREIEPETDEVRKARYQDLRGRFLLDYGSYRSEHEAQMAAEESRETLRADRGSLLEALQILATLGDQAKMAQELTQIDTRWNGLEPLPEKEQASFARKFAAVRQDVTSRLEDLTAMARRNERMRELLQRAESTLERNKPLHRKQVRNLLDEAKPLLDAKGADKAIAARFAEKREALDERLRKQRQHAEQRLAQLPEKVDELSKALEEGSLKDAEPLFQSVTAGIELIEQSGLPRKSVAETAARVKAMAPRLRDLQKWRRWGADQHRQELCATMEELISTDLSMEATSLRLHDLQMQWKGLDTGGSPVSHPLWERFHTASERVYEHCKPFLETQAAEREANRQMREQLCRELEEFLGRVDWERMDWKMAARAEREMRQAWSAIGPMEGRHRKELEKRFRNALKRLDANLAQERTRNQALKRELIEKVEALVEEPDLQRAIDETKRLQRDWRTTVPARQKEENRLWQRFRAACDAVFARRQARNAAYSAELGENLKQRENLCDEAEKLASSDNVADELASALRELDKRWRDAEMLAVPRQAEAQLSKRWREARDQIERSRQKRLEEQRRKDLDLLADQAAQCERLERVAEAGTATGTETAVADAIAAWEAGPKRRDSHLQAAIEKRFNTAADALREGGDKQAALRGSFAADGRRRAELCLQLEILAKVDSPPELTQERLQFQVNRLTEHMRAGEKDPLEATSGLLQEWYLCGPAPISEAAALEERFMRARRAIEKADRDEGAV